MTFDHPDTTSAPTLATLTPDVSPTSEVSRGRRVAGMLVVVVCTAVHLPGAPAPVLLGIGALLALVLLPHLAVSSLNKILVVLITSAVMGFIALAATHAGLSLELTNQSLRIALYVFAIYALKRTFLLRDAELLASVAAGVLILWLPNPPDATFPSYWKYALAVPVSVIALAPLRSQVGSRQRAIYAAIGALVIISGLAAHRSVAIVLLSTAFIVWIRSSPKLQGRVRLVWSLAIFAVVALLSLTVLPQMATDGMFGNSIRSSFLKNETVSANPVFGGRAELPVSLSAVLESPLIGHGTTPVVNSEILDRATNIARVLGINVGPGALRVWVNPTTGAVSAHSVSMEMWISSGVIGFVAALMIIYVIIRSVKRALTSSNDVSVGWIFLCLNMTWDMLFSPLLTGRDILISCVLVIALGAPHITQGVLSSPVKGKSFSSKYPRA